MKKLLGVVIVGGAIVGILMALGKKMSEADSATFFKKMQARIDAMPEDFPPRVLCDNIAKTRENSDRILEILETTESASEKPKVVAS